MTLFTCDDTTHPKSIVFLALGLLIFTVFQLTQVLQDRVNLSQAHTQIKTNVAEIDKALAEGDKMLEQLNDVAIATQKLADGGNANAKEIVTQMNRMGIKIDPNFKKGQKPAVPGAPATPPSAATPPAAPTPPATPPKP